MKKRFGIFWIGTQRKIYGDDSYYVLGTLMGVEDTYENAEIEMRKIKSSRRNFLTIIPIYTN